MQKFDLIGGKNNGIHYSRFISKVSTDKTMREPVKKSNSEALKDDSKKRE